MSTKIAIVPSDLRDVARTYRESGRSLDEIRTQLGAPVPEMPGSLAARVRDTVGRSQRDVAEQVGYIGAEATALERRAVWAEKADRGDWTWLLEMFDTWGLGGIPTLSDRFGQASRPDLEALRREYQVASEGEPRKWEPPWPLSEFTDVEMLTEKEIGLINSLSLLKLKAFRDIRDRARDVSHDRYDGQGGEDGHEDAFRHAYWNAMLVRKFGDTFAEKYATAHETVPNPATREAMDLYNNERGRQVALDNPDASDEELADLIQRSLDGGDLLVIDGASKLQWSDRVAPGATGITDGELLDDGKQAEGADSGDAVRGSGS